MKYVDEYVNNNKKHIYGRIDKPPPFFLLYLRCTQKQYIFTRAITSSSYHQSINHIVLNNINEKHASAVI